MVLTVYTHPFSQPGRAVLLFVRLANIEHRLVLLNPMRGEHMTPAFLTKFPQGQVPAISDGDFNLEESHAILTYLATTRHVADHWYPADPRRRALVDRYLHWHHGNLRRAKMVLVATFGHLPEPFVTEAYETRGKSFAQLEAWLTDNPYLAGSEMSIADLSALCEVTQHGLMDFDLSPYPHVFNWRNRLLEVPVIAETHEALRELRETLESWGPKRPKKAGHK